MAVRIGGSDFFRSVIDTNLKVLPEIGRAWNKGSRGSRVRACRGRNKRPVSFRQFNVDKDSDDFLPLGTVVELGLLSAVVTDVGIGTGDGLDERCADADRRNVRAGFGRREEPGVLRKQTGIGPVMALAEEISLANGFGGERSSESEGGRREKENSGENRDGSGDELGEHNWVLQTLTREWTEAFPVRMAAMSKIVYKIETELEADGRWIAEIVDVPGVLAYGTTEKEAMASAQALALRVLAERMACH